MKHIELDSNWLMSTVTRIVGEQEQVGFTIFNPNDGKTRTTGEFAPEYDNTNIDDKDGVCLWFSHLPGARILQEELAISILRLQGYKITTPANNKDVFQL